MNYREGNLSFEFSGANTVIKLDARETKLPHGMQFVDFVVEQEKEIYLIEVKDPFQKRVPEKEKARYFKELENGARLINEVFVPKARDSYTYLHLMERDSKPFVYIVLIAEGEDFSKKDLDILLSTGLQTRLKNRIQKEAEKPWKRKYIQNCIILTLKKWKELFPDWTIRRREESA